MSSQKRPADGSAAEASARGPAARMAARRVASVVPRVYKLLLPAVLSLALLAGCSVMPGASAWSNKQALSPSRPSPRRREAGEKKPLFGSWFGREEPEPLKTTDDWMALEQIRP